MDDQPKKVKAKKTGTDKPKNTEHAAQCTCFPCAVKRMSKGDL